MRLANLLYKILGDHRYNKYLEYRYYNKTLKKYKNKKKILYFLIPTHGNLGDQAIAYASNIYLKENFEEYEVIEINCEDTYRYSKWIKKIIKSDDIIFLHGGGNMGNHYIMEEEARRYIIDNFKDNKIVSFTQTMYFSNDAEGNRELRKSKEIYNRHNNLTLIAREDKSYKLMREQFNNCRIIKCPDIVFYLNERLKNQKYKERKNIMTCFRSDKEMYLKEEKKNEFIMRLNQIYKDVVLSDTVIPNKINSQVRENELFKIWDKFSEAKIVITDRLHGMIFCAITKTPCIAIRSLDYKITESYKWIKNLNYIRLVDNLEFENIQKVINELLELENIDKLNLNEKYFNKLKNKII